MFHSCWVGSEICRCWILEWNGYTCLLYKHTKRSCDLNVFERFYYLHNVIAPACVFNLLLSSSFLQRRGCCFHCSHSHCRSIYAFVYPSRSLRDPQTQIFIPFVRPPNDELKCNTQLHNHNNRPSLSTHQNHLMKREALPQLQLLFFYYYYSWRSLVLRA